MRNVSLVLSVLFFAGLGMAAIQLIHTDDSDLVNLAHTQLEDEGLLNQVNGPEDDETNTNEVTKRNQVLKPAESAVNQSNADLYPMDHLTNTTSANGAFNNSGEPLGSEQAQEDIKTVRNDSDEIKTADKEPSDKLGKIQKISIDLDNEVELDDESLQDLQVQVDDLDIKVDKASDPDTPEDNPLHKTKEEKP